MSPWRLIAEAFGQRLDADLIPALYAAASVPTHEIRDELRASGHAFVDEATGVFPEPDELARTVAWVTRTSTRRALVLGVAAGAVGFAAVAPAVLASATSSLRLAQRLAVVHGFDPDTDAGRLVISRALAFAYDVQIPAATRVTTRVSELPALVGPLGSTGALTRWVGRQAFTGSVVAVVARVTRLVPGLGAAAAGVSALRTQSRHAQRMCEVYARATEALPFELGGESLADEVR
ncbi:MAG: hypothetical protein EXR71_19535 [Myxococcales bacterium]|nr:hypothetical protein [Myxococcales bacterium]